MDAIKSVAEEGGVPFETRCELATEHLHEGWKMIQRMASESLAVRHDHTVQASEMKGLLQYMETGSDQDKGEMIVNSFDEFWKKFSELEQTFFKRTWDKMTSSSRELFGSDATDFALKAISRERSGN